MKRTEKEQRVFGNILLLSNKLQMVGDGLLPELTLKQWFLLIFISKMEDRSATIKNIADGMGCTRQNIKHILGPLERKGFVEIKKSEIDSRALAISLTDKSHAYFIENERICDININKLFENISNDELNTVFFTLDKLMKSAIEFSPEEN